MAWASALPLAAGAGVGVAAVHHHAAHPPAARLQHALRQQHRRGLHPVGREHRRGGGGVSAATSPMSSPPFFLMPAATPAKRKPSAAHGHRGVSDALRRVVSGARQPARGGVWNSSDPEALRPMNLSPTRRRPRLSSLPWHFLYFLPRAAGTRIVAADLGLLAADGLALGSAPSARGRPPRGRPPRRGGAWRRRARRCARRSSCRTCRRRRARPCWRCLRLERGDRAPLRAGSATLEQLAARRCAWMRSIISLNRSKPSFLYSFLGSFWP